MTEFKKLQDAAYMTNEEAARILKISERTVTRYRVIPDAAPFSILFTLSNIKNTNFSEVGGNE